MRIHNRILRINNKYIRNIKPEINYPKYEEVIKRKEQYETFSLLLKQNKNIKDKNKRLSYKQIEQ
jgi:hypothetical protein